FWRGCKAPLQDGKREPDGPSSFIIGEGFGAVKLLTRSRGLLCKVAPQHRKACTVQWMQRAPERAACHRILGGFPSPCGALGLKLQLDARRHENVPRNDRRQAARGTVGNPPPCRCEGWPSSGE